jgi:protein TonB
MTVQQRQNRITVAFILLSLLLHLLLLLVPKHQLFPADATPQPVYVEVRPPQPRDRELDIPIRKELEKPREKPAKRLAEENQVVEREQAPEGKHTEDREKTVRTPKPTQKPVPPAQKPPEPSTEPVAQATEPLPQMPITPEGWKSTPKETPTRPTPDLQTLTRLSTETLAKVESELRRRYREDIAKGDTVWMDTEQDLLISFMRRFRTNIYNVWNYPAAAVQREQQGTCLLRITVDRRGNIVNVQLLESSGFSILDDEAMQAVRQGASYGPLPRAYPNEELKIMAFFQYHLDGIVRRTYRPRPGDLY